jgi:D-glycero-D-manno-heptose 1,7-bisphosphate phosphatase
VGRRAAFLDRDGTLNAKPPAHHYVEDVADLELLPGIAEGAARLADAGYALMVVSNQRGLARGLVSRETLAAIEAEIQRALAVAGARIEAFRYCPHELDEGCACRKPRPGMLLDLAAEHDLDLDGSWMIGDADSDVVAGHAAGCRSALVGEGRNSAADVVEPTLALCAERITAAERG